MHHFLSILLINIFENPISNDFSINYVNNCIYETHYDWTPEPIGVNESILHAITGRYSDKAKNLLKTDPIMVINGDTILNINLQASLNEFKRNKYESAAVYTTNYLIRSLHTINVSHCGAMFISQNALKKLDANHSVIIISGYYLDIGTPEGYLLVQRTIKPPV